MNRRQFLKTAGLGAGAALAFPSIISAAATGKDGRPAPSNRITMGVIGIGWIGTANMNSFLNKDEVQIVGVCDIDRSRRDEAKDAIDKHYDNHDCKQYNDFRELIGRGDLDAITIGLPDHWHAVAAIYALSAGLDVYGEKPFSKTLLEGRAMCNAVKRYGRIWQTGSWQRSCDNFHRACELVRNGRIGKVHTVEVVLGGGVADFCGTKDRTAPEPVPEGVDFDMWLGPAQWAPYRPACFHKNWRWNRNFGGGILMDWIGHHGDIAHWGLGLDNTGPVEIEGTGTRLEGVWNIMTEYKCTCTYANGVVMSVSSDGRGGTTWYGDKGEVHVNRGVLEARPESILNEVIGPDEIRLYKSTDHYGNFLDCIRTRSETITPCETAHRSASVGHLCQIAMDVGRKIRWDPEKEQILGDEQAARLLGRPMRSPWRI